MKNKPFVDELVMAAPSGFKAAAVRMVGAMVHRWDWAMVVILALLVWAPRFSGPIDLRWDAGVYYLLGTSLAKGEGYRISSEPGAPEALQYPPLLPALVALHQWALGTTDPSIVAPWLRSSYAALFVAYSLVVLALAKRHLLPGFALAATALCLLNMMTIFLSDLLFAELPFAVVSVVFALVAASGLPTSRPWMRETASFALAAAGFFLRTMGVALLAAWVMEALIRRRWRLAVLRAAFALLPIVLWQTHVARVRGSDEYRRPAYNYQRAPYQYYNVSYAENVGLIDPFRPELGKINPGALAARLVTNLAQYASGSWRGGKCDQEILAIGSRAHEPPAWPPPSPGRSRMGANPRIWDSCCGRRRHPRPPRRLVNGIYNPRVGRACLHDALARSIHALSDTAGPFPDDRRCLGLVLDWCHAADAGTWLGGHSRTCGARQRPGACVHRAGLRRAMDVSSPPGRFGFQVCSCREQR